MSSDDKTVLENRVSNLEDRVTPVENFVMEANRTMAEVRATLISVVKAIEKMNNNQPGETPMCKIHQESLHSFTIRMDEMEKRQSRVENRIWYIIGIGVAAIFVLDKFVK
jgi:uncharacterized coiled-coil protein SlyX